MLDENTLKKIKQYSGANKNTEELFNLETTELDNYINDYYTCLLYTSPSPRDA